MSKPSEHLPAASASPLPPRGAAPLVPEAGAGPGVGLAWIKSEVTQRLEQADGLLSGDASLLDGPAIEQACESLHEVRHALDLVGHGPWPLLLREVAALAKSLPQAQPGQARRRQGLIAHAIGLVREHLARADAGTTVSAVTLVPLLDEMRIARGANMLSETGRLPPASVLAGQLVGQPMNRVDGTAARERLEALHARFREFVLGWHKGGLTGERGEDLLELLDRLGELSHGSAAGQLWWAAAALAEACRDRGLVAGGAVRRLVMRLDPVVGRLRESGAARDRDARWVVLLQQLLQYVAASTSDGARVREVRLAFGLDRLFKTAESGPARSGAATDAGTDTDAGALAAPDRDADELARYGRQALTLLETIEEALARWTRDRGSRAEQQRVFDALHSLTLGAQSAGVDVIAELGSCVEDVLLDIIRGSRTANREAMELVFEAIGCLVSQVRLMCERRRPQRAPTLIGALQALGLAADGSGARDQAAAQGTSPAAPDTPLVESLAEPRLSESYLERLGRLSREMDVTGSGLELQFDGARHGREELGLVATRLTDLLRRLRLQLDVKLDGSQAPSPVRDLLQSVHEVTLDLDTIDRELGEVERTSATLLRRQRSASTQLYEELTDKRSVPFATVATHLQDVIRRRSAGAGVRGSLLVSGHNVRLDRGVLRRLMPNLERVLDVLLAGAAHPGGRARLALGVGRSGPMVEILATNERRLDRGPGAPEPIDGEPVVERLDSRRSLGVARLRKLLPELKANLAELGGTVEARVGTDGASRFLLRFPAHLETAQVLFVRVGSEQLGITLSHVVGVARIRPERARRMLAAPGRRYRYQDEHYLAARLADLVELGDADAGTEHSLLDTDRSPSLVLLRDGTARIAVIVDAISTSRGGSLQSLSAPMDSLRHLDGAVATGDGQFAFVLNVEELARLGHELAANARARATPEPGATPASVVQARPTVMVVDDSRTIRRVLGGRITRAGYEVITARDGFEALGMLQDAVPDVVLLDLEMPRMDGFGLVERLKRDPRLAALPVILVTSQGSAETRHRVAELGIDRHFIKPWSESELLEAVANLVGKTHG